MNDKISVLVTGSDGFIGRHLVPYLAAQGYRVIAASRNAPAFDDPNIVFARLPDLSTPFDWQPLLQDCDAVVHLAGIAHTFADEDQYDRVNHQATEQSCSGRTSLRHASGFRLVYRRSVPLIFGI